MQVKLAGYNLDIELVELLHRISNEYTHGRGYSASLEKLLEELIVDPLSPETISAAYARISRSPKGIRELRRNSRISINRARRSNENIVFGFGHASVAEHAVFNLDVTSASRLALEELEAHRLASYTEGSQRYISMTENYLIPDEILKIDMKREMTDYCSKLFEIYEKLIEVLTEYHSDLPEKDRAGKAREDARYVLPLACLGQVGMTVNARTAEQMIKSFKQSSLKEVKLMGKQLLEEIRGVAPSLIKYTEPDLQLGKVNNSLKASASEISTSKESDPEDVVLLTFPEEGEVKIIASILFKNGYCSYSDALEVSQSMTKEECSEFLNRAHSYMSEHDTLRREMELGYFTYSITLSSSAFAQFKRHRMCTLLSQDYDLRLGFTIPPNIIAADSVELFNNAMEISGDFFKKVSQLLDYKSRSAANYTLTNAHRRRIIFQANARELNHLSRLRQDSHAQWDIRQLADKIIKLAREKCQGLMQFACGKEDFKKMRTKLSK